ncbi:MAG: DUF1684 domain-containing protein [Actinomycetota bacterium]|nr:DUF1684 domain-containing protein [Actinomycetota bacterium]
MTLPAGDLLDLLDWKRRVFELYAEVRAADGDEGAWRRWRSVRDELFASHSQSPIPPEARASFAGLPYFDHDPAARVLADVEPAEPEHYEIGTSDGGTYGFTRFGVARFSLYGRDLALEAYWLEGYGGGVFLPFRDATAGRETYGAGRYLLDTVKGSDLGAEDGRLVLDFNFAYNPSCAYDPRWACPLAPPPNRLDVEVRAGERYVGAAAQGE